MPCKNAIKEYEAGSYYHIYNRGVAKRTIFKSPKDYKTFLSFLKFYLTDPTLRGESSQDRLPSAPSKILKNYCGEIELIAYCLMPNHFHLFLRQSTEQGINHFMRSLATKYTKYFNTRYKRVGHLFQGAYKAVRVTNEYQFTYVTKYIHRNPLSLPNFKENPHVLQDYPYSSYGNYVHKFEQIWVNPHDILAYFSKTNPGLTYESFVVARDTDDIEIIKYQTLDLE